MFEPRSTDQMHILVEEMLTLGHAKICPWNKNYAISKCGEIFSRYRLGMWHKIAMSYGASGKRYLSAYVGKKMLVHRAVYLCFKHYMPKHLVVRHLDGNYFNNCLENLALGTQSQNMRDFHKHRQSLIQGKISVEQNHSKKNP